MSAADNFAAPPSDIATKGELDQRLDARPEPVPKQHLTPSGWEMAETQRQVDTANEKRIAVLRNSLDHAHDMLHTDHWQARLRGRAKADFGRSR